MRSKWSIRGMVVLISILLLSVICITTASAAKTMSSYDIKVNGKTVTVTTSMISHSTAASIYTNSCRNTAVGTGSHVCCAGYGVALYKKLWGADFNYKDSILKNLSSEERRVSNDNFRWFFSQAKPGSLVRFDAGGYTYRTNNGHELVFLGLTKDGAVFWEGNYDGKGNVRIWSCDWPELYSRFKNKGRNYIAYIMYPKSSPIAALPAFEPGVYQFNKDDESREGPAEKYDISSKYASGSVVFVESNTINDYGNTWYKLSTGKYVYSGDIDKVTLTETAVNDTFTFTSYAEAKKYPFSSATTMNTYSSGSKVIAVAKVTNTSGESWYRLSDNTYVPGSSMSNDIPVTGFDMAWMSYMVVGGAEQISISAVPYNATNQGVSWSSSDTSVATVDSNGIVQAVSSGKVTITVTANDGHGATGSCEITVMPASGSCGDSLTWIYSDGQLTISGTGAMYDYEADKAPWAGYSEKIKQIQLGDGITYIGSNAFYGTAAANVFLPSSLKSIGSSAFRDSALEVINLPGSLESISENCFSGTRLTWIDWPSNIPIKSWTFENCENLSHFIVSDNVTVNDEAFKGCKKLTIYCIDGSPVQTYAANNSIPYVIIGGSCGDQATWYYDSLNNLTIRGSGAMADYSWYNAPWSQYRKGIRRIEIENGITAIGDFAFIGCLNLTDALIPDSVTRIGDLAFDNCQSIQSITLPVNLEYIGHSAFAACTSLSSITIPGKTKTIVGSAFGGCEKMQAFAVDSDNPAYTSIDGVLFSKDGTELIIYPCGRAGAYIVPDSTQLIGAYSFNRCSLLTDIYIPENVKTIGEWTFMNCNSLSTVALPEGVIMIKDGAFTDCTNLTDIYLPFSLKNLGNDSLKSEKLTAHVYSNSASMDYAIQNNIAYTVLESKAVESIEWDHIELKPGETGKISCKVYPEDATIKEIAAVPIDNSICTVYADGSVYAKACGVTEVELRSASNPEVICTGKLYIHDPFDYHYQATVDSEGYINISFRGDGNVDDVLYGFRLVMNNAVEFDMVSVTLPDCENIPQKTNKKFSGNDESWEQWIDVFAEDEKDAFPACTNVVFKFRPIEMEGLWETTQDYIGRFYAFKYGLDFALEREKIDFSIRITFPEDPGSDVTNPFISPDLTVPSANNKIVSEAFYGIGASLIKLPETISSIESLAFAYCENLTGIYIPAKCKSIASDAFEGDTGVVIFAPAGSYAETYAGEYGFRFVAVED